MIASTTPESPSHSPSAESPPTRQPPRLLDQLRHALRVKHYSYKTEKSYVAWVTNLTGPRRPSHLPEILNHEEALALLDAATTLRDRLLIGLLYGCGLTVGELRRLRWRDLDPDTMTLRAPGNLQILPRTVRLPDALLPLVETARAQCPPDTCVLPGAREGRALSTRWIEFLTSETARRAGILKPVSPRTLRDTYAVQCLETGANIRELQTVLGHRSVRTTLRYTRCMLPPGATSPLDRELPTLARPPNTTPSDTLQSAKLNPTPRLLEQVSSASEFLCLLGMQLGKRIFSRRRATHAHLPQAGSGNTGPP